MDEDGMLAAQSSDIYRANQTTNSLAQWDIDHSCINAIVAIVPVSMSHRSKGYQTNQLVGISRFGGDQSCCTVPRWLD